MTDASAAYFERVAGEWDAIRTHLFTEAVRESAIAHAYLRPDSVVADVGSGTGFLAAGLAPAVSRVVALDGSAAMLEAARRNLAAHDNVEYRAGDGSTLPLPDGSVDAALANMYLHHCPDPAAAIREMARIVRPGGRVVITDMDSHQHEWLRAEQADEWLGFERDRVVGWMREAGLVNVYADCTGESCCADSEGSPGSRAEVTVFVAAGTKRVAGARESVQASYGALARGGGCCGPQAPAAEFTADIPLSASCCSPAPVVLDLESGAPVAGPGCAPANAMPLVEAAPAADEVLWDAGYTAEQVAAVPAEAAELALGCGNPAALASLRPGETVLDIGSGAGIDAFYAAQRVGPAGRVIGIDMTPAMIERARRAAGRAGLTNVEFRLGQAEAMPVDGGSVDVILSNCVINLCEDKGRVFEEAHRVLVPGGRLAVSDMVTDGPLPLAVRSDPFGWAGCVSGALPEREYLDLVRAAGFSDVKAERSRSGGRIAGVSVYSLSVTARKGQAAGG